MIEKRRILYAVQGTGNGHLARATEILPMLKEYGEVDMLISGNQHQLKIPGQRTLYRHGLTLHYDAHGAISLRRTLWNLSLSRLIREILGLPVRDYDWVISDFECVSAWACLLKGKKCLGLSHQAAFRSRLSPRPKKRNMLGELILQFYAPVRHSLGFHFQSYDTHITGPIIRRAVRELQPSSGNDFLVYLPAYSDQALLDFLRKISNVHWIVFSKNCPEKYQRYNVTFQPIHSQNFLEAMAACAGVFCSAGFETPAETLYLGKKLLVIPIKGQYEQQCNAAALRQMGVPVISQLSQRSAQSVGQWAYAPEDTRQGVDAYEACQSLRTFLDGIPSPSLHRSGRERPAVFSFLKL